MSKPNCSFKVEKKPATLATSMLEGLPTEVLLRMHVDLSSVLFSRGIKLEVVYAG